MNKPSLFERIKYRLGIYVKGWVYCPKHGWTYDELLHGYRNGHYYHMCQKCDYYIDVAI